MDMLRSLSLAGLVPVIKLKDAKDAIPLCAALKEGGLPVAEITFRTDAAEESIRRVHESMPDILLGAGTVLTCEQADRAVKAGAGYIVAPGFNPTVVKHCIESGYPVLPGCANPSDIERALEMGLKTVKFFPAEALGGLKLIKAMSAPYGDVKFVPTGGINADNLTAYLAFPKVAACGGSWIVPDDAVAAGDFERVTRLTRQAVDLMLGLELAHIGINANDEENALSLAGALSSLLSMPVKEGNSSVFAGSRFECVKSKGRGQNGHIAISTGNVGRARWHLEKRGYRFDDASAVSDQDGLKAIYLNDEIGGFAFHLTRK